MGKLHTLKRAIIRNPEFWIDHVNINNKHVVNSAIFRSGQWCPYEVNIDGWNPEKVNRKSSDNPFRPYRRYVVKVLRSLGYDPVG